MEYPCHELTWGNGIAVDVLHWLISRSHSTQVLRIEVDVPYTSDEHM